MTGTTGAAASGPSAGDSGSPPRVGGSDQDALDQLIEGARAGDLPSFNRIVLRFQDRVYGLSVRMLGSPEAAEDVSQETFIRAYRRLETFRGGKFDSWLLTIAANLCRDELRRGASSGSDTGELAPPQPATITPAPPAGASTADAPPRDVAPADTTTSDNDDGSTKTPPPPAETGPGTPPSTGGAANLGDATTIEPQPAGGDTADTAAVAPEAGTEEAIAASDLGGDDGTDFVPAFAVLTALLTALAALRWAQTRRTA